MTSTLEQKVWARAHSLCEYCQMPQKYDELDFELDHIIAQQHEGKTVFANLALSCLPCNRYKGPNLAGIDPQTGKIARLFHPRRHRWLSRFRWDGPELVGRTPIGRATVTVLKINLPHRIRLRKELIEEGVFPPLRQ